MDKVKESSNLSLQNWSEYFGRSIIIVPPLLKIKLIFTDNIVLEGGGRGKGGGG